MKANYFKKSILTVFTFLMVVIGFTVTPQITAKAATKVVKNTVVTPNKATKVQLDGKGGKETVLFKKTVTRKTKVNEAIGWKYDEITTKGTLYINGKKIKSASNVITTLEGDKAFDGLQVVITDINKKDNVKDILFASATGDWCGKYNFIYHYQYKSGKVKTDNLLKTLQSIEKKVPKATETFEWPREVTLSDCIEGLSKEFTTTGDGTLQWNVCLTQNSTLGYAHGTMKMKLSGSKILLSGSMPSGSINEIGNAVDRKKMNTAKISPTCKTTIKVYTTAGGSKKAFSLKKNSLLKITGYKFVGSKLYYKVKNSSGKTGWIQVSKLMGKIYRKGTLHA